MQRQFISSSNLASVGDEPTKKILEIEFNHGGVYQYFDIPESEHQALMSADSHGSYFVHEIKGSYSYHQIR